jgi:hypothetical protein
MDVLSITTKYREDLLKFVKPILSEKAYIWVKNLMSDINHKVVSSDNEYISVKALIMYRNIIPFFKGYCSELTASSILFTLYACAVELNVRNVGDVIESYEEFQEDIDMEDWGFVTEKTIKDFDILVAELLIRKYSTNEDVEIWAGGLYTLQTMDFI